MHYLIQEYQTFQNGEIINVIQKLIVSAHLYLSVSYFVHSWFGQIKLCLRDEVHASNSWKYQMGSEEEGRGVKRTEPILDYMCRYQDNWPEHVNSMSRTRISKAIMHYQPRGKR
jgi:hypothetical protein